ncbi:MAG: hypothetical protein A2Z04_01120 [Chloroflexi bacterium RBG_16_57_9]|nr:MAG: hypothetical protein A2Z04_01120 [Chloroflexi bacterium RBG_16_57_9]
MPPRPPAVVTIVGVGLMGGSLGMALRQRRLCREVIGVVRQPEQIDEAIRLGAIDRGTTHLAAAVSEADLVVLATPVRTILAQLGQIGPHLRPGAIVTDMGSTKSAIMQAMAGLPPHVQPVGSHPMCGKEVAGIGAAEPTLFQGATWVVTPLERSAAWAVATVRGLAEAIGARSLTLEPDRHDRLVAAISHVPYLLAVALVAVAEEVGADDDRVWHLAASGFRDTSRLAASDVTMMLDILMTNPRYVTNLLRQVSAQAGELANLLIQAEEGRLCEALERAARRRSQMYKPIGS